MHHAEGVLHGHRLRAFGLQIDVGAAQARQDQRVLAVGQVAAVELGADLHRQIAIGQGLERAMAVRRGLGEVAAQGDEHFRLAVGHGVDRLDHVVAVLTRNLELEAPLQRVEERHWRTFVDAHGPVALHVAVAATGHRPAPGRPMLPRSIITLAISWMVATE